MVGPVAEFVAAPVGGGVAWLSPGRMALAHSVNESTSRLARRRTANDAGRPGENWFCLSLILATGYYGNLIVARPFSHESASGARGFQVGSRLQHLIEPPAR
jgi:hypothetical protein